MDKIRPILYGVSDYAEIRRTNAWFVDRTAKIRDLEATRFAMFLRPRRFGKSMLISILQAYYDVRYAARFEELFAGTAIGENPTEEHNQYLILYFNFSVVSKEGAPAATPGDRAAGALRRGPRSGDRMAARQRGRTRRTPPHRPGLPRRKLPALRKRLENT